MENSKSLRLFSQETLDSAVMSEIYGGDSDTNPTNCGNCGNCSNCYEGCKNPILCGVIIDIPNGKKCSQSES